MAEISRRRWLQGAAATWAMAECGWALDLKPVLDLGPVLDLPRARPAMADRHFTGTAVEELIPRVQRQIGDKALATIFENCFPNTLDTTVFPGTYAGKPDTYVVTGDIDAMWLRDSSAQVWPYVPLAKEDAKLRERMHSCATRKRRL